ncbi:hypothetical protein [Weissella confusa]|uniref:hypothetical protein n=1 Tax=Weissella confusa TaxID=1583 RepID=UPI000587DA65|nr:hypothetical protein [Weissella confusa]
MKKMKVWKDSTPRLLAVDESGTAKMISDYNKRTEENRWIVISGVIFSQKSNLVNIKLILDLKNKYWKNGEFNGQRVVFHAREIKKGIGPFSEKILSGKILLMICVKQYVIWIFKLLVSQLISIITLINIRSSQRILIH